MIVCASGDTHGALDRLFQDVVEFERACKVRFEALLHVGDFGVWPDPARVDRATRDHEGAGDFPKWLADGRRAPVPTWFIKGNHEDFEWLETHGVSEVLPGLHYIRNGNAVEIGDGPRRIRVAGIGGCFGPSDFRKPGKQLKGYSRRHYTLDEIEKAKKLRSVDVLLLHDAPLGIAIQKGRRGYVSTAEGLAEAVSFMRPRVCFFGHHHARVRDEVDGVPCIGLNIVGRPGHLVAVEIEERGRQWRILGEWPEEGEYSPPVWSKPPACD